MTTSSEATTQTGTEDAFAAGCAWIEGEYVPIAEARIPILDAGFVRSDLTYDVVGVWEGSFFRLAGSHGPARARVQADPARPAEAAVGDRADHDRDGSTLRAARGVRGDGRHARRPGAGGAGSAPLDPKAVRLRDPVRVDRRPEQQELGTQVIVARDTRRIPAGSVDPTVKNFHWGDLVRGLFEAYDRDAWLPILLDGDGLVSEGPASTCSRSWTASC